MASYTDKIPTFNPYVQQLPVDAMVKVGMYKQQKYEEGLEKIQTNIDNVAGMDIANDADKAYLQSKLNDLGNNLKGVAAGDFSNFQLVNSVNGMTNQIVKDRNIQTAIVSTQQLRKGQSELETAKKAGKSSVQNEDYWNDQVGKYLSNKEVGSNFSGKYVQYTDLTKKYGDIAKDVEAIEYSYDQPYKTDSKGNTLYFDKKDNASLDPSKGTAQYDDAMKRITTKGKSAQTILNNFYDSTTENDKQQLAIDGRYHYKNKTADSVKKDIVDTFEIQKKQISQYATELNVALKSPKISDVDKAKYQAQLNDINSKIESGDAEKELASSLAALDNPAVLEEYKNKVYTKTYLTNLAQDKSTQSYKEELLNNPYFQASMEKQKFQFDINKENTRINQWNADHELDVLTYKAGRQDKLDEKIQKQKDALGAEPITHEGAIRTDIPSTTAVDINNRITDNLDQIKKLNAEFIGENKGYTVATLNKFASQYDQDPSSLNLKDNDLRAYLSQRRQLDHDNLHNYNLLKGVNTHTKGIDDQLATAFKGFGGIVDRNGRELYSSKDLYSVIKQYQSSIKSKNYGGEGRQQVILDENKLIGRFKGTKNEAVARAFVKYFKNQPMSATEKTIVDRTKVIGSKFDPIASNLVSQKLTAETKYLNAHMPENMTMAGSLNQTNKVDMQNTDALISDSMNPELGILDLKKTKDYNPDTVSTWRADPKAKLNYQIIKNYDGSGELIVQNGTEKQTIPMTPQTFKAYYPRYAATNPVTQMKSMIMASPSNTTNINQKGDPIGAQFTGYSIPLLNGTTIAKNVRYDVEGAKSNRGGKVDSYQIRLYAFDGRLWHNSVINQQGYIGEESIQDAINGIGMDAVNYTLKQ